MKTPKLNDKYQAFGNDSRYFIITGGRGSGKSFAVNVFLLLLTYERGHKILFTRYTMVSAASSIIPEFIEKLEMMGVSEDFRITKDEITNIKTKSSILFKGIRTASGNQTASLKSLNAITTFVLDEAEELTSEDDFDKIDQSVRVKNKQNRCVLILNPTTKEHWIFNRFFENRHIPDGFNGIKGGITYIHTTYLDNKDNLSISFLNQIQDIRRRRPEKYNHQIMGAWLEKQEGVIFRNWRIGEFNENYDLYYGQDFGFSIDPTVLVKLSIDKKGRRIFCKTMYCKAGLSTTQIADYNIRYAGPHLIICDSSEPRLIKEVKLKGVNIRPTVKRSGSILTGIALLQDFDLIVDPDSTELIKELNNYVWATKGQTKPVDKWNHNIDAIRYAAQYALEGFNKGSYSIR
ncbi:MAG: putative terminase large subunit [Prokaryotic dsDNA virus sp.]|nr:MAG: putative terminase large subunit [Prokaryotic dsDNA virus sp.]|tara:strand:+ start:6244 stop:7455 length:1212 start_codon:yes stop_codon:yes gene_type:complete